MTRPDEKPLQRRKELKKVKGIMRSLFRLPILLYHWGLGKLLGERFLLLKHQGRKSKKWHETVIEVAGKDAADDVYYVVAAWAEKADWWQNLRKNPICWVNVGRKHFKATASTLSPEDAEKVILEYAHLHPAAIRSIAKFMGFDLDGSDEQYRQLARQVPLVALKPH